MVFLFSFPLPNLLNLSTHPIPLSRALTSPPLPSPVPLSPLHL